METGEVETKSDNTGGDIGLLSRVLALEKASAEKDKRIVTLETKLNELTRSNEVLARQLEELQIKVEGSCEEKHDAIKEAVGVLENEVRENMEAVTASLKKVDESFKKVSERNEQGKSTLRAISEVIVEEIDTIKKEVARDRETMELAKKQFQTKMDKIQEESLKSDKSFEENFSSLFHASKEKMKKAAGFLVSLNQRSHTQGHAGLSKLVDVPFCKETPVWSKYKDNSGRKTQIGRILEVQNFDGQKSLLSKLCPRSTGREKTILLVGATGAGKSTLIDGIANFVFNVRFEDKHRLRLIKLLKEEEQKKSNQAVSQTIHLTVYKIPVMKEGNIPFNLNIIDTPGVGDTRGLKHDKELLHKLETLFSSSEVPFLNAVCFVAHSGSARLTPAQKFTFDHIISGFGKDVKDNLVGLFTFDDGTEPKALDAFAEAEISLAASFSFNSLGVLGGRTQATKVDKSVMMTPEAPRCTQFQNFYDNCDKFMAVLDSMSDKRTEMSAQV